MSPHALVDAYAAAVSDGDFDRLDKLVHADAVFDGTVASKACGADAFVQGFRNLRPITLRTDVRSVVVEDDRAAVMYDLVTATAVGSVLCSEFLTLDAGLIRSSTLIFDWRRWPEVIDELRRRSALPVA
jgi:ketosteroid isomerase-like protein